MQRIVEFLRFPLTFFRKSVYLFIERAKEKYSPIGRPRANNVLLYGYRGTGKSATVKAVCSKFADKGLRLVYVSKKELTELPQILQALSRRGLCFVIFIDDLSFESGDDNFNALKGVLEGGIDERPNNVVIYATSNRRHLVKESHADRPENGAVTSAGDLRSFDTMQEKLSLADRFGITVVFASCSQDEYLHIAEHIARGRGVLQDAKGGASDTALAAFRENALRWERWCNGRSPRTAKQYVDFLESGAAVFPWE